MKVAVVCGFLVVCAHAGWGAAFGSGQADPNALCAKTESDEVVIMKGHAQNDKWLPVEMKQSWITALVSLAAVITAFIASIGACLAARAT